MLSLNIVWTVFHNDGTTISNQEHLVNWDKATHITFETEQHKTTIVIPRANDGCHWRLVHRIYSADPTIETFILVEYDEKLKTQNAIHFLMNGIVHSCHTYMCSLMEEWMQATYEGNLLAVENLHGRLQTTTDAILK